RIAAGDEYLVDIVAQTFRADVAGGVDDLVLAHGLDRILPAQAPAAMRRTHGGRFEQNSAPVETLDADDRPVLELDENCGFVTAPPLVVADLLLARVVDVLPRERADLGAVEAVERFRLGDLLAQKRGNEFDEVAVLRTRHASPLCLDRCPEVRARNIGKRLDHVT